MKSIVRSGLIVVLFTLFTATGIFAAEIKIGILDIQKLQEKSTVFKKRKDTVQNKLKAQRTRVEQENAALSKLESDFQKQRPVLGQDALKDKIVEIEAKRRLVKFLAEDYNEAAKVADIEANQTTENDLSEVLKNYARQGQFTVILDKRTLGLLWSDGAIDITDKIMEIFDRTVKP